MKIKKKKMQQDISLNITAMADIFTVLLVFLLKSYASGAMTIHPTASLDLATSTQNKSEAVEAIKIEISKDHVVLEGESVVNLNSFEFPSSEIHGLGVSKSLYESLTQLKEKQKSTSDKIIVIADKATPYKSMKVLLSSAAAVGLTDFKVAVRGVE